MPGLNQVGSQSGRDQRREQRRQVAVDLVRRPEQRRQQDAADEQVGRADREQRRPGRPGRPTSGRRRLVTPSPIGAVPGGLRGMRRLAGRSVIAAARRSAAERGRSTRVGEARRPGRAAQVVGRRRALGDDVADGRLELGRGVRVAEVAEHQRAGQDQRGRVRLVQAGVLRRRAVDRLEDGGLGADVGARRDAEAADQPGAQVADDVAVQVRQDQHVVQRRASGRAACTCCRRCGPRTRSGRRTRRRSSGSSRGRGRRTAS